MKLIKVHVQNYRSILDSGEIEIEKIKTVLVGINEAGKTALLKAINQLNPASEIERVSLLRDFPRSKYAEHIKGQNIDELCKNTPLVSGTFILEPSDIKIIQSTFKEVLETDIDLTKIIYIKNKFYQGHNHTLENINRFTWGEIKKDILRLNEALSLVNNSEELITTINTLLQQASGDHFYINESQSDSLKKLIEKCEIKIDEDNKKELERINKIYKILNTNIIYYKLIKHLYEKLPKFVYFNNYIKVKPLIHLERLANRQENNQLDDKYYDYGNISLLKFLGYSARELANLGKTNENQTDLEAYTNLLDDRFYRLNAASINLSKSIQDIWNPNNQKDEASNLEMALD